ncbi:MAG: suppressor of fused domain protein [Pseudomonadales bacterium]|nr:suppressor of fused domain protein [Pseudomonadales bacterium]
MDTIELTQEQHDIYVFAMEQSPLSANANLKNYHFDEAVTDDHVVAYARMGAEEQNAWGILALPEISTKVFVGITDSDPETYSELLASFEAESEVNDAIGLGHIAAVKKDFFTQAGWSGILMTRVSDLVDGFPDSEALNGEIYDFHLVVPITQEEMIYGQRNGGEALIEKMHQNQRDFFTFFQSPILDENVSPKPEVVKPSNSNTPDQNTPTDLITDNIAREEEAIPAPPLALSDKDLPEFEDLAQQKIDLTDLESTAVQNPISKQIAGKLAQFFDMDDESAATGPKEETSQQQKITSHKYWHVSKKNQVIGETIIGTLLLVGGAFFSGQLYSSNYGILSIFTAVFSVAGLIILVSAFKDSQALTS